MGAGRALSPGSAERIGVGGTLTAELTPLRFREPFAPLLTVAGERVFNHRQGMCSGLDFVHFDSFALQLLIVEEETAQHTEAMLRHLAGLGVGVELRIMDCDGDYLVVLLTCV